MIIKNINLKKRNMIEHNFTISDIRIRTTYKVV